MVYPAALPWALGVAAFFWALRWLVTRRPSVPTPADVPVLLLTLLIPVTLWATALPEKTWPQVLRLLTGIALFYTFANWAGTLARLRLLADGAAGAGLLLALAAPIVVLWSANEKLPFLPTGLYDRFPTLVADTANPNVMAGTLALFFPLALSLLLFAWPATGLLTRLLAAAGTLAGGAALILTQSRGALFATAAAVVAVTALRWRRAWLLWIAAAAGGYGLLQAAGVADPLALLATNQTLGSLNGRLEVWSRAQYMIQDFPFTGIGMGSFTEVADLLYPFFLHAPGRVLHTHNLFLQVAVDLGLPGLVGWLALWLLACASAWGIYRQGRMTAAPWTAGLGAGLLGSQVALGAHGLLDAVTWGMVRPAPLVWALWGLAAAGVNVLAREAGRRRDPQP